MRRWQRNILLSIACIIVLVLLLPLVIYIPPVQQMASQYAQTWIAENTPMQLSLKRFSLKFPLRIALEDVLVTTASNDTLVYSELLQADVALTPLLRGKIVVRDVSLQNSDIDYITADSTMHVRANIGGAAIYNGDIELKNNKVYAGDINFNQSQVELWYRTKVDTTTTDSAPLDWDIAIANINLEGIDFDMYMPGTIDTLQVRLPQAHIAEGNISLLQQTVDVASIEIEQADYRYIARSKAPDTAPSDVALDTVASMPWQVEVGKVQLTDNSATYITSYNPPQPGIDFSHIVADKMDVTLNDVYNRGGDIRLLIGNITLRERSGIYITQTRGHFAMQDTGMITLSDFSLATPFSDVTAYVAIDPELFDQQPDAAVDMLVNAHLSARDIVSLYPDARQLFVHPYNENNWAAISDIFTLDIEASGVGKNIVVSQLDLLQPGYFTFRGDAQLNHALNKSLRNIAFTGRLNTTPHITLANYIPDSALAQRIVMQPIELNTNLHLQGNDIAADAWLQCMEGEIDLDATYNMANEAYNAEVAISQFPVSTFLPHDTIDNLSAHVLLSGQHFALDNPDTRAEAKISLQNLDFKRYTYRDINIHATAKEGDWSLVASSDLDEMDFHVDASGIYQPNLLTANLDAKIDMLDLTALNLTQQSLDLRTRINSEIVLSNIDSVVQTYIEIDSLELGIGDYVYYTNSLNLLAASDITYSYIDLNTGDMTLNLSSDAGLKHLQPSFERLTQFVDTIIQKQRLNMDELHRGLPPFVLSAHMGTDNILHRYLGSRGIGLSSVGIEVSNDTLFNLSALVQQLKVSSVQLDTITLKAYEKNARLNYSLALDNRPGNLDKFAHIGIEGFLSGNSTRLYCIQNNREGETGFLFGCKIDFSPEIIQLTFGPKEPIIGYKKWELNRDNFLTYNPTQRMLDADVRLWYDNSHFYITTKAPDNTNMGGVRVDIQDIELSDWFAVTPFTTPLSGLLSAEAFVASHDKEIAADGNIELKNFIYNTHNVGSFNADIAYLLDKQSVNHIQADLHHNNANILKGKVVLDSGTPKAIDGDIAIEKMPLAISNAFISSSESKVSGTLNSRLNLSGTVERPNINGFVRFEDATAQINDIGVSLALDNNDITIKNSRISLKNYGIRGANNNPLKIDGSLDISDLSNIGINLDLQGNNFQPINSAENRLVTLYGSVYTDIDAQVRGSLNDLKINGDISLLSGTNATYIMQSSGMMSNTDYSDMVSFVSFADTLSGNLQDVRMKRKSSLSAAIDIDIDQGVQLGVNLSPDGNNRIDLIGGGNLIYTASALGDNHVTGRYVLTGGFVRYTPPFISQKIFNIKDGSYVLWNGNIADPSFNITATQTQRSSVKTGEDSRLVDFDVSIIISNTLKNLDISFDLATTDDITIQNELQSLTEEQRETKAMNMFLYNSYDNLASAAENAFVNNPLNTFLEYELNTWAQRTLRGVDLTFGIDNYGLDETGMKRTDYSYQFSKSLFDNRLKFVIGGSYASNQDVTQNLRENLIDDISLEYRLTKRDNMYLKVFRQTGYESIIEGEITQTGAGFLFRKQVKSLLDLFRKKPKTTKQEDEKEIESQQDSVADDTPDETQPIAQPATTPDKSL